MRQDKLTSYIIDTPNPQAYAVFSRSAEGVAPAMNDRKTRLSGAGDLAGPAEAVPTTPRETREISHHSGQPVSINIYTSDRERLRRTFSPGATESLLYSAEERRRRDASPWTRVQAVLAPIQFGVF